MAPSRFSFPVVALLVSWAGGCDRDQPTADVAPPPPSTSALAATRSGGVASALAEAYEQGSVLEGRGHLTQAAKRFAAACRAEHWPSCIRLAGYHALGLGPHPVDPALAGTVLSTPCRAGERLACSLRMLIGFAVPVAGLASSTAVMTDASGWATAQADCERRDDGQACLLLATRALANDDIPQGRELAWRACEHGATEACVLDLAPPPGSSLEQARQQLVRRTERGCRGGNAEACSAWATERYLDALRGGTKHPEMERELARICAAEPSRHWSGSIHRPDNGLVAGACGGLAEHLRRRAPDSPQVAALAARACLLGIDDFCRGPRR